MWLPVSVDIRLGGAGPGPTMVSRPTKGTCIHSNKLTSSSAAPMLAKIIMSFSPQLRPVFLVTPRDCGLDM